MSVGIKERGEFELLDIGCAGTLTTSSLCGICLIPFSCQLKSVIARLGTAGGTQATIVDVLKNGVSIFNPATKINFAAKSATPTYGAFTATTIPFAKGDILKAVVTQVGSANAPADLGLAVVVQRGRACYVYGSPATDTIGYEAE